MLYMYNKITGNKPGAICFHIRGKEVWIRKDQIAHHDKELKEIIIPGHEAVRAGLELDKAW